MVLLCVATYINVRTMFAIYVCDKKIFSLIYSYNSFTLCHRFSSDEIWLYFYSGFVFNDK